MRGHPLKDVAASVRQRLLNCARATSRPFNELLQYYAMERFLYRLSESPHADRFVLKGALMLTAWQAPLSRPTMDIDFLGRLRNDVATAVGVLRDVCLQEVAPDGLVFDEAGIEGQRIAEAANYHGVRVRIRGSLGTARIVLQIDIGFGDVVVPSAVPIEYPTLLELPAPRIQGYSRESAIAEKFEAMTRLGLLNSRMKDFFDIWLLARQFQFDGQTLALAVQKTFDNRGTEIQSQPVALTNAFAEDPAKQAQWRAFIRRSRLESAPEQLRAVISDLTVFLCPVTEAVTANRPFESRWSPPGPWEAMRPD